MIEREMEDLIAAHAEEFFPRRILVYGAMAHRVAEALNYRPGPFPDGKPHWWRTLSHWNDATPQAEEGQDQWIMRPELAQALLELKWV